MQYGLIGQSLAHSFSQQFFTERFAEWGLNHEYRNFELAEASEIEGLLAREDCQGFNVTIPYKESVLPYLTTLDAHAQAIGAVNTLVRSKDQWQGYNTDFLGFGSHLQEIFPDNWDRKALILGTGGAAKAVAYALSLLSFEFSLVSRKATGNTLSYGQAQEDLDRYALIINTTPKGTFPNVSEQPLLIPLGHPKQLYYDLIYNPSETAWLQTARSHGAMVSNGLEMLKRQALASWDLWQGKPLPILSR